MRLHDHELEVRVVVYGLVMGALLSAANVYAGLKIGIIDGGTAPIVLVAFALFGAGQRRFTSAQANTSQVLGGSAALAPLTAGLLGPIPALVMSGQDISPLVVVIWGSTLAVLGTVLARPWRIPLVEVGKLAFPSGRAAGELAARLFAVGAARDRVSVPLLFAMIALAAITLVTRDVLAWFPADIVLPISIGVVPAAALSLGVQISPLMAGIGILIGARIAITILIGSLIAWVVLAPALVERGVVEADYGSIVGWTLWPGTSLMVAGALVSLLFDAPSLVRGIRERSTSGFDRRSAVVLAIATAIVIAVGAFELDISPLWSALAIVLAVIFSVAAMQATGETDYTPAGPLGGLTQIVVGTVGPGGTATPLYGGAVVNGVAAHSSSMLQAWRSGQIAGNSVRGLFVAQLAGIALGTIVGVAAYALVDAAYGIGTQDIPAPGPMSWKATAEAVERGTDSMPDGAPIAALVAAAAGAVLAIGSRSRRLGRYLPSPAALGVGFLLPAAPVVTMVLAALAFAVIARAAPRWHAQRVPVVAAGLIIGEAITGLVLAALVVAGVR